MILLPNFIKHKYLRKIIWDLLVNNQIKFDKVLLQPEAIGETKFYYDFHQKQIIIVYLRKEPYLINASLFLYNLNKFLNTVNKNYQKITLKEMNILIKDLNIMFQKINTKTHAI